MHESTTDAIQFPAGSETIAVGSVRDALTEVLREGARKLLADAVESEVKDYIDRHTSLRDAQGQRLVVRNGHKNEREIQTGIGAVKVRQPRVNDRRTDQNGQRTASPVRSCHRTCGGPGASRNSFRGCTSRASAPANSVRR